ncbi:hypothetical protein H7J70_02610 [Mycolicibacterium celeriflavum]|nr:hypothetical protein [Mycolicibacterium celeriflavum]ORA48917.1 hypothetical protein BST21_09230 [Mycolicibacterium celeriflavum]
MKTFWCGADGWSDRQGADGTVVWTAPNGQTYTTTPGGAEFFEQLGRPTGEVLPAPPTCGPLDIHRGAMMPIRRRTRAEDKAYRIALERQHNAARLRRIQLLLAERLSRDDEPPPF